MCGRFTLHTPEEEIRRAFHLEYGDRLGLIPRFNIAPSQDIPIVRGTDTDKELVMVKWGLVPHWVKDVDQAGRIRFQTLNARSETIFEKPSYRDPIRSSRCLVLVDGFFEFRDYRGVKYPYLIRLRSEEAFALAGVWETWNDLRTFSIVTTEANPLMAEIHNTKKRMPVILPRDLERDWIDPGIDTGRIQELMAPYDENDMKAHTVSRKLASRFEDTNVPDILKEVRYPELEVRSLDSFL